MYYSDELIEQIRVNNDIVDVISSYVKLQKKGGSYVGLCPFHNEKSPSFSVDRIKQMFYCFGCTQGGNVYTFIMKYENYSFPEAVAMLAQRANIELPKIEYSKEARQKEDTKAAIYEMNTLAAKYFYAQMKSESGEIAKDYFQKRELEDETIIQFGLGYACKYSDDLLKYLKLKGYSDELIAKSGLVNIKDNFEMYDKFWNRVMFPIFDINSKVIGFGGRVMGEGNPKYLNSPETLVFDKSRNLYGLNIARTSRKNYFIICEGYMDVIALHQAGFTNAVASLGTAFTSGQASLIKRYVKEVYLTYDSDEAGTRAALRAVPILKEAGISAKIIRMDPYKDPDEFIKALGAEGFDDRIGKARNGFMYGLEVLQRDFDMESPEGKTRFYQEVALKLIGFEEELERNNYIEATANEYKIPIEGLKKLVSKMAIEKGLSPSYERPKKAEKKRGHEESKLTTQKALITWMVNDENVFAIVSEFVKPHEFTKEIYQIVAELLYKQYEVGEINPSKIINHFTKEEEHQEVASLFHTRIDGINEDTDKSMKEKAIKEAIIKMKRVAIDEATKNLNATDIQGLMELMNMKKSLEEYEKLDIVLR